MSSTAPLIAKGGAGRYVSAKKLDARLSEQRRLSAKIKRIVTTRPDKVDELPKLMERLNVVNRAIQQIRLGMGEVIPKGKSYGA